MQEQITRWLADWREGDAAARDHLIGALYPELRRVARGMFRSERSDHTLQPTALVNEAWIRLAGSSMDASNDRSHLVAVLARSMRQILIDHARRRSAGKRDGGQRVGLTQLQLSEDPDAVNMLDLDKALHQLEEVDEMKARIVELRYFAGLSIEETAEALDSSPATIKRHWQLARVWLYDALAGEAGGYAPPVD